MVKTEYSIKGLIPGTFDLVKVDGKWLLNDFNIDGQGENTRDGALYRIFAFSI